MEVAICQGMGPVHSSNSSCFCFGSRLKKISCLSLRGDEGCIYVGTEGGNVYSLDANKFEITDKTIYMDVVLQK